MIYNYGTPVSDDTLPMVLWDNEMSQGTTTASSSATDAPFTNALTETTFDYWKPTALPAYLDNVQSVAYATSSLALVGHNLGSTGSAFKLDYLGAIHTNNLTYSEQFDNAAWIKGATTISADIAKAPNASITADKIIANATTAQHYVSSSSVSISNGVSYTISVYLKAAGTNTAVISCANTNCGFPSVNLSNGAITSGPVGSYSEYINNGWFRVVIPVTASSTTTTSVIIWVGTSSSYLGNGTDGIYAWGAQFESGGTVDSYIATTSTALSSSYHDAFNWTIPLDDTTILVNHKISAASTNWRLLINGATVPYVGICILGTSLVLPGGVKPGYTPIWQAQKVELLQSKSLGGQFLGNRILRQGAETSIGLVSFSRTFAEADLQLFKAWYNGGHAFIWASGPSIFTKDVGYCWRKPNAEMRPTFTETGNWVDVTMEVEAYVQ